MDHAAQLSALAAVAERMAIESGNPQGFSAADWLAAWLEEPVPALGNRRPRDVLLDPGGFEQVRTILLRMQSGAYS